ncbi:MAG: hypothetical protein JWQ76_801 [Ramlibacter sp.]|nr:hypothetical protein [Ramlibacter sp.]
MAPVDAPRIVAAPGDSPVSDCAPTISNEAVALRGETLRTRGAAIFSLMNTPVNDAPMTPEERIDAALEESFPASDAPWWSLGVPSSRELREEDESGQASAARRQVVQRS